MSVNTGIIRRMADRKPCQTVSTFCSIIAKKRVTNLGLGRQSVGWALNALLIAHLHNMAGEISVLKGLQGAKGYLF